MSMQTDLQAAVDKAQAASGKLHDVVNGDAASTVVTESGPVKTVAKAVADIEADINASRAELDQKVLDTAASAGAASISATSAAGSSTAAAISAGTAVTSETNTATSANAASTSETNAATSETNAAASASAAATSETNAGTSATNAATSETSAATSATNAATSETSAAASASSAGTSASNAAASETAAAAHAAGGLYSTVQEKSAAYTFVVLDQGDLFKVDAASGPLTITLTALATLGEDSRLAVQKTDTSANAVTVTASGADTINGAASITLNDQWELYEFVGDASTGKWTAHEKAASNLAGGDGISKSGSVISVDLAVNAGLEFSAGKLKASASIRAMDMPFNAGFGPDYNGENLAVQTYAELVLSRPGRFTGEVGYIDTVATGSAAIFDVLKNGTSIYAALPQFAVSTNTLTAGILNTDGTGDFIAGDRVTFKCTQVGATVAGQKARFTVLAEYI